MTMMTERPVAAPTGSAPGSARLAGVLFLVTHVTSVAAVGLYGGSALDPHAELAGRTSVITGALLEVVLALAVVGTSVALYPLLRGRGPGLAIAYVALRILEAGVILLGVVTVLAAVARPATADLPELSGDAVAALHLVHDWTFLIGPGFVAPLHTVVLAWLLLRHRLIPRWIPLVGMAGAVVTQAHNLALLYGLIAPQLVTAVPIFAWELSLAVFLILRGLRGLGT